MKTHDKYYVFARRRRRMQFQKEKNKQTTTFISKMCKKGSESKENEKEFKRNRLYNEIVPFLSIRQ